MAMPARQLRWLEKYPDVGQDPVPVEPCISPEFYQREMEKVFRRVWLKVGRVEEIPAPGNFKLKQLHFARTGVILVRGEEGGIRAFHNTCSHRGNNVIPPEGEETFGRKRVFSCRFHGWGYDDRGRLCVVPEEERFPPCFRRADNGLTPVHCDVWEGFIFVNLAERPAKSLEEYLGAMGDHFSGFPYHELTYGFTYYTYLNCNWKIGLDAFSEAYHVNTIHAGSFPGTFSTGLQMVQLLGDHRTSAVCFNPPREMPPIATLGFRKARGSLVNNVEQTMLPPQLNPERRDDYSFEMSMFFPNWLLHVAEGIWFTHQFWPIAHDKCLWQGHYHVRAPRTHSERWALEHAMCLQRNAWLEDTATMEGTHFSLESRAKKYINLQDEEILIRHSYHVLDRYMREP
jgi:phenylpropionate dioxygenase-like ring-hydroxylating dioxygenase large terminal subunit